MVNLVETAAEQLRTLITDALNRIVYAGAVSVSALPAFNIEIPGDKSHGDFASNAALVCAKGFRLPPRKIAEMIAAEIDLAGTYYKRAEIADPGFMNFFLSPQWFADAVTAVLIGGDGYGRTDFGGNRRVLHEFVSANPTGPAWGLSSAPSPRASASIWITSART